MNPLLVESAMQSALAVSAFTTTTIYTGTGYQELTPESLNLIVAVTELEHTVGSLYKAHVTVKVSAPALLAASELSLLTSVLETLRTSALTDGYLSAHWPSGTPNYAGVWVEQTAMSQHEHEWICDIKVLIGVSE